MPGAFCVGAIIVLNKICPYCGKLIRQDESHTCRHKSYNQTREPDMTRFYTSRQWESARAYCKARALGADEYIMATTGRIEPGSIAHHIVPVRENPKLRLDLNNLIFISSKTHDMIHAAYSRAGDEKAAMITKLQEIRGQGRV